MKALRRSLTRENAHVHRKTTGISNDSRPNQMIVKKVRMTSEKEISLDGFDNGWWWHNLKIVLEALFLPGIINRGTEKLFSMKIA